MSSVCLHCDKDNVKHTCHVCQKAKYCDEKCAKDNWLIHQKKCNVYHVPNDTYIAVPYMFEDFATKEDLRGCKTDGIFNQIHLLKTVNADGTEQEREQIGLKMPLGEDTYEGKVSKALFKDNIGAGKTEPDTKELGDTYVITISYYKGGFPTSLEPTKTHQFFGKISRDMIFRENTNEDASNLAKYRKKNREKYVFWPPNVKKERFRLPTEGGFLKIDLQTYNDADSENKTYSTMKIAYGNLLESAKVTRNFMKNLKGLLSNFTRQAKIKGIVGKNSSALYSKSTRTSMEIRMVYDTTGQDDDRLLKDIEVSVSSNHMDDFVGEEIEPDTVYFDARDIDDMTGLSMGLNYKIGEMERDGLECDNVHAILNVIDNHRIKYQKYLNDGNDFELYEIDSDINTAISQAQFLRYEEINGLYSKTRRKLYAKKHKNDTLEDLQDAANELELSEVDTDSGWRAKFKSSAKRGEIKGHIRALRKLARDGKRKHPELAEEYQTLVDDLNEKLGE